MKYLPLTQTQLGMFLEWNADRTSVQYNLCTDSIFPRGAVDAARLAAAVKTVLEHYPIFRMRLSEREGEIVQFTEESSAFAVETRTAKEDELTEVYASFRRPFDPFTEPMARAEIVTTESATHLLTDFFHLIYDGSSEEFFFTAVSAAYEGRELPREEMTFAEYAELEPSLLATDAYRNAKAEHAARFAGKTMTAVEDGTGSKSKSKCGAAGIIRATARLSRKEVEAFCRANEIHPNLFFMGTFARTLALYANANESVFYTINHGRRDPRFKRSIGAFVKTVPVLAELKWGNPLTANLKNLKLHHVGDYPFTHFSRDLGIKPGFGYVFQDETVCHVLTLDGVPSVTSRFSPIGVGHIPAFQVFGDAKEFILDVSVLPGTYSESWCRDFVNRIAEVARQFLAHPDALLKDIPILSESDEREILALGTGERLDYDDSTTFVDLFLRHAKATPDAKAVVAANGTLTYGELDEKSSALAAKLVDQGVKPGDFVAVKLARVKEFPLAVIAIWKAGAAYVPVDPEYPAERIAYMLEDSGARAVIDERFLGETDFSRSGSRMPNNLATPSGTAYMIYTSGSTGKPKGVAVTHANLRCFIEWLGRMVNVQPGDQIGEFVSFSFDGSTGDLYPSLANGATLHILSSELRHDLDGMRRYIAENRIRGMVLISSMAIELLSDGEIALDYLLVGGERVVPFRPIPTLDFYNAYGPTEFTNMAVAGLVDQTFPDNSIPIGRPVPGTLCAIVDPAGRLLPRGMVGELVLAGNQLSRGYWHRPELTNEKFASFPWLASAQLAYRTGDLCRWREDGRLDYCGRIDNQVKLRGFRIEMGEIESAMAKFPGVAAAVADVKKVNGIEHLVGYYVDQAGDNADEDQKAEALRDFLARSLTDYMVPDTFMRLERLPLTPNGKVDRKKLPVPEVNADKIVAPETERERALFAVVASLLGTEAFGVTTNLISMGLTSLRAIRLSAAIRKATGLVISTGEILAKPTIREWTGFEASQAETIAVMPPREAYPLTANQLGVYLDWEHNRAGLQYNVPSALRFEGLDAAKLRDAVEKTVAAHPYFKVHLEVRDGAVVQLRRDDAVLKVSFAKLDQEPDAAFFQSRVRPFDLLKDDLARFEVYSHPKAAYLFFDVHHIIFDGGAANIFLTDMMAVLSGGAPTPEAASAYDYALHDSAWQASEAFAKAETHFDELIRGTESFFLSPARGGAVATGRVAALASRVPLAAIRAKCRATGVTENAFFATVFCETLRRLSRTDDVQIATVSSGRSLAQLANTIGMFVETLPLVSRKPKGSAAEAVRTMQAQIAETIRHDRYPFTKLSERHGLKPNVLYVYQGGVIDNFSANPNLGPEPVPLALDTTKVPLALNVTPKGDVYELAFEYDIGLYGPEEIGTLAEAARCLAESLSALGAGAPISQAALVDSRMADELLSLGRGEAIAYDHNETFVDLFLRHAKATPDAKAVVAANGTLTYGELDEKSSALAAKLVDRGVKPGDFVAVKLARVKEFPLAVIAIWKAGAAYVPVDPEYPAERIAYMLEDSGAKVVIDERLVEATDLSRSGSRKPNSLATPSELAYMIYTSGSTGKPKGVMVAHANLRAFLAWLPDELGLKPGEAVAEHASFSFDASICDLYTSLASGATLHIVSSELRKDLDGLVKYFSDNRIVGATLSTQLGMELLNASDLKLRYMVLGGEKLKHVKKTSVRLYNGYGPTEFTCWSSHHIVDQERDGEDIPIGRAIPNSISAIVDPTGNLLPRGMVGELVLAGDQISRGYWNRPELTKERFAALPCMKCRSAYRTGDLARWDENGELRYCGRIDNQVKLRGFRIEMGEIESAMSKFPGVAAAVADVKQVNGGEHLVGYYVDQAGDNADEGQKSEALRDFLARSLTDYMVPDVFMRLEKLPMTPNGKVDRKALPIPAPDLLGGEYVEPATVEEHTLCAAYGRILGLSQYGAETDFFRAGGSSLDGIRLVAELQRLGFKVVYGDLFKHKTPRNLAAFLGDAERPSQTVKAAQTSVTFAPGAYDYAAIDTLLAKTPIEPNDGVAVHALQSVLLTGVTGYLGVHILKQLLETANCRVILLVRPKRGLTVEGRVTAQYFYYFEQTLSEAAKERLSFVEGDITDVDLAAKLAEVRFDTLFNCAALVKHYVADDLLDRVNVEGARNLVEICAAHGARLVQMSTASVGGMAARGTLLDERCLYVGQTTQNDYVRTKYEAERLVLEAIAAGRIGGKVMRLGNLMGRETDGVFQMNFRANAFVNAIRTLARLGVVPLADAAMRTEFSQIDLVAEAVVKLSATPDSMVVFHPFSPYKQDLGSVIDVMNMLGRRIDFVSKSEFASRVEAMRNDAHRAKDLQGLLHYGQRGSDDLRPVEAVNDWTTVVLRRLGFLWKPPAEGYLETFFRFLDSLQFFD